MLVAEALTGDVRSTLSADNAGASMMAGTLFACR